MMFFGNDIYHKIYKKIKQYDYIVLAHHIGPDSDALGSTFGLKEIILNKFPHKHVYVVGSGVAKFRFIGIPDKFEDELYDKALLIVCDTPDIKRVDGIDVKRFKESIKIDHHPFIEKYCDLEWIDPTASSVSQMILELVESTRFTLNRAAAAKLFVGIVSDTERFLYDYTSPKTFRLVADAIEETGLEFTKYYLPLYLRPIKDLRFQSYIMSNLIVTENGFGYIKLTDDILKEYEVDAATAGNLINNFNYINEVIVWAFFSEDKGNGFIRGSVRSRGPIINTILEQYGGGGHALAAGVKPESFEIVDEIIDELDKACLTYKSEQE